MPSAVCPHCLEQAYSSAQFKGPWTCPSCGEVVVPEPANWSAVVDATVQRYADYWLRKQS